MSFRQQGAVQSPTALDLLTAIGGTKSLSTLDGLARAIWTDWGAGRLSDEQASALAETLEGRKREVRGVDTVANRAPHVGLDPTVVSPAAKSILRQFCADRGPDFLQKASFVKSDAPTGRHAVALIHETRPGSTGEMSKVSP